MKRRYEFSLGMDGASEYYDLKEWVLASEGLAAVERAAELITVRNNRSLMDDVGFFRPDFRCRDEPEELVDLDNDPWQSVIYVSVEGRPLPVRAFRVYEANSETIRALTQYILGKARYYPTIAWPDYLVKLDQAINFPPKCK